jgi:hypothetical protein
MATNMANRPVHFTLYLHDTVLSLHLKKVTYVQSNCGILQNLSFLQTALSQ